MRVLVACEFSGVVRDAFRAQGHDAWSCDLLPTDKPGPHIQDDILRVLRLGASYGASPFEPYRLPDGSHRYPEDWDLLIAHPPCTYLANSGVRWLYDNGKPDPKRWSQMYKAARFFNHLLNTDALRTCVENPIIHGHAGLPKPTQIIQPWQFGHGETKATCLWLKNLPPLEPTNIVEGRAARVHREPPSPDRWKRRSVTYQGIADAMAAQWGNL